MPTPAHRDPAGTPRRLRHHPRRADLRGGPVPTSTYARIWQAARQAALTAAPLAARPYDLRQACVSTWLNAGVPASQVTAWAGHSIDVRLEVYAKCVDGQDEAVRRRIETALGIEPPADREC